MTACTTNNEPLTFKDVALDDSVILEATIHDYNWDTEEDNVREGFSHSYITKNTIIATGGNPEAMKFINEYLILEASGEEIDSIINATTVAAGFAKLQAMGIETIEAALAHRKERFAQEAQEIEELPYETGNSYEETVEAVFNTTRLLTLHFSGYEMYAGAAHGMPWSTSITFDLQKQCKLSIDDMLTAEGQAFALNKIKDIIEKESGWTEEDYQSMYDGSFPLPYNAPGLYHDGLHFEYGAYEIGPFALGLPEAVISLDELSPYFTPKFKALLDEGEQTKK